jgi:hypothetical protein
MSAPVVIAGLGSAVFFAVSSVAKHVTAGRGPDAPHLHFGSIRDFALGTVRHPLWVAGIAADAAGLTLQVVALHLGALSVVQPLLLSGLVFAILLRGAVARRLLFRQACWALVIAASLGGFLLVSSGGKGSALSEVDTVPAVICTLCGIALVVAATSLSARVRTLSARAGLMGIAAGTIYAATAALIKSLTHVAVQGFVPFVSSWQLYALVITGAVGLVVAQIAFRSGPMSAGLPIASTVDPVMSIVIGVAVYDEKLRLGPGHGSLLVMLLLVLCAANVHLARLGDTDSAALTRNVRRRAQEGSAPPEGVDVPLAAHR